MKTAEVDINKSMHIKLNDKEHKRFKLACVKNEEEMSVVLRRYMRQHVKEFK